MDFRELQELGYYLIPIEPHGKKPCAGFGAAHKSNDLKTIEKWAEKYPGCNWGIVCENVIVFDLDTNPGMPESEMLQDWIYLSELYGIDFYPTVITGSGGRHFYFRRPSAPIKGVVKFPYIKDGSTVKSNIDIRVGTQYVVAPGSVHESGNIYEGELIPVSELAELPQEFIDILPQQGKKELKQVKGDYIDNDWAVSRCRMWLEKCDPAVSGQGGHSQILKAANAIFWGFGLSKSAGWDLFQEYNNRCDPPFDDWELEHKYQETQTRPQDKEFGYLAGSKPVEDKYTTAAGKLVDGLIAPKQDKPNRGSLILTCGSDIELTPEKWLWEDRILLGSLTVVFGIGAVGKSSLILEWAARVTAGTDWPDGAENPEGTVLFFSSEETPDNAKAKVQFWGGNLKNFYYINGCRDSDGNRDVFDMTQDRLLEDAIERINNNPEKPNVRLIILDPVASVLGDANENSNKEVRGMLERLNPILSKYDVACIGISHSRKPTLDTGTLSRHRLAGSIAFANLPRTVWEVIKEDSGKCLMLVSKSNLTEQPKGLSYHFDEAIKRKELLGRKLSHLIYDDPEIETCMDTYIQSCKEDKPKKLTKKEQAAEWLKDFLGFGEKPLGLKTKEINSIVYQAELAGFSYNQLSRAVDDGNIEIVRYTDNGTTYWKLPDPTEEEMFGRNINV